MMFNESPEGQTHYDPEAERLEKLLSRLTVEFVEKIAQEEGWNFPVLIDAEGIRVFLEAGFREGFIAAKENDHVNPAK